MLSKGKMPESSVQVFSVASASWMRDGHYIKALHPRSLRTIYLVDEQADVFEALDDGLEQHEVLEKMAAKYTDFTGERLEEIITMLCDIGIVAITDQFG